MKYGHRIGVDPHHPRGRHGHLYRGLLHRLQAKALPALPRNFPMKGFFLDRRRVGRAALRCGRVGLDHHAHLRLHFFQPAHHIGCGRRHRFRLNGFARDRRCEGDAQPQDYEPDAKAAAPAGRLDHGFPAGGFRSDLAHLRATLPGGSQGAEKEGGPVVGRSVFKLQVLILLFFIILISP